MASRSEHVQAAVRGRAAREGLGRSLRRAPSVPWHTFEPTFLETWRPGEHVTLLGPTGTGKSTLLIELAEASPYCVFVATKERDPLLAELPRRGWRLIRDAKAEIHYQEGRPIQRDRHLIFWPQASGSIRGRKATQAEQVRRLLDRLFAMGAWTVAADEALWISQELKLEPELRAYWHQGRSAGLTILAASQRPRYLPVTAYSSASYLFLFGTNDREDLRRLSDIGGGLDTDQLRRELQTLRRFEFVCVAPREQPPIVIRSKVEL